MQISAEKASVESAKYAGKNMNYEYCIIRIR
jgi:hypothetical protein